jgi:hypothetical protein
MQLRCGEKRVNERQREYPISNQASLFELRRTGYSISKKGQGLPLRQTASATSPKQGRSTFILTLYQELQYTLITKKNRTKREHPTH